MNKSPGSHTNPFKDQNCNSLGVSNHFINASRLLSQFISSSFKNFINLFGQNKSTHESQINQTKSKFSAESQSIKPKLGSSKRIYKFQGSFLNIEITKDELLDRQKSNKQERIKNKKVTFVQNVEITFNKNKSISKSEDYLLGSQNLFKQPEKPSKYDIVGGQRKKRVDLSEDELQKYQNGRKKRKIEEKYDKLTRTAKREIDLVLIQPTKITSHFRQIENQAIIDLVNIQPQASTPIIDFSNFEAEAKSTIIQGKNQILANYEKMMYKPRKIEIVRQSKDARKLLRQLKSKQQDAEKRFQLYKQQRWRKIKEKLNSEMVSELKLDSIVPTYEKIVAEQRQEKIKYLQQKREIQEANSKKTFIGIQSLEQKKNSVSQQKLTGQTAIQLKSQELDNSFKQVKPNGGINATEKQAIIQKSVNKQGICVQIDKAQPQLKISILQNTQKQLKKPNIEGHFLRLNNINKQQLYSTNLAQQKVSTVAVLQTPKKSSNFQKNLNQEFKTQTVNIENKQQEQKVIPPTQSTAKKANPFLTSTPSSKLSMQDLINKNPQYTIFQKTEPISPIPPQAIQPSTAANVFMPTNATNNAFKFNQQPQSIPQPSITQFQSNTNNFVCPQPSQTQQIQPSSFMVRSQNPQINQNFSQFNQSVQHNYPSQSYNMYQNNNQTNRGFQPGMFAADTNHARSLFQTNQPTNQAPSLFGTPRPATTNQDNRSNYRQGASARNNRKPKDIRIS